MRESIAGEARFDGADAVVSLVDTAPTWTSAASAAAWKALFDRPTENGVSRYVTGVRVLVTGAAVKGSLAGATPSAADGLNIPVAPYELELCDAPEAIRAAKFYVPAAAQLNVTLLWGRLG